MKRKSLFGLAMLLFLSSVALSNERSLYRCRMAGNLPNTAPCTTAQAPACPHAVTTCPHAVTATPAQAPSQVAAAHPGSHVLLHTVIKLLYI